MSDEEKQAIEEQYKVGLVNLSNVIEPLINQFKTDYSLDIQQCRLIINYLLMERDFNETYYDELDKEIEELKVKNDLYEKTRQLFENSLLGYIKGYEDGRNGNTGLAYKVGKEFADYTLSLQLNRYKESYLEVRKELDNSVSKDKIKTKIEVLENDPNNIEEHNCLRADTCYVINILQSLLEKE